MNNWLRTPSAVDGSRSFRHCILATAAIYVTIMGLATGEWARGFKAVASGILSPIGVLFALFVAFTAQHVLDDNTRAEAGVNREAGALSAVLFLTASFPGDPEAKMQSLISQYIEDRNPGVAGDGT
jgi:hypothetical protein